MRAITLPTPGRTSVTLTGIWILVTIFVLVTTRVWADDLNDLRKVVAALDEAGETGNTMESVMSASITGSEFDRRENKLKLNIERVCARIICAVPILISEDFPGIENSHYNAFAASEFVAIGVGFADLNETALAFVIEHELAHIALGHTATKDRRSDDKQVQIELAADASATHAMQHTGYSIDEIKLGATQAMSILPLDVCRNNTFQKRFNGIDFRNSESMNLCVSTLSQFLGTSTRHPSLIRRIANIQRQL